MLCHTQRTFLISLVPPQYRTWTKTLLLEHIAVLLNKGMTTRVASFDTGCSWLFHLPSKCSTALESSMWGQPISLGRILVLGIKMDANHKQEKHGAETIGGWLSKSSDSFPIDLLGYDSMGTLIIYSISLLGHLSIGYCYEASGWCDIALLPESVDWLTDWLTCRALCRKATLMLGEVL